MKNINKQAKVLRTTSPAPKVQGSFIFLQSIAPFTTSSQLPTSLLPPASPFPVLLLPTPSLPESLLRTSPPTSLLPTLLLSFFLLLTPSHLFAVTHNQSTQSIRHLEQQQEQQRQQELIQREIEEAERIRKSRIGKDGVMDKTIKPTSPSDEIKDKEEKERQKKHCVKFKEIKTEGNKVYSQKTLNKKVFQKYIGECIGRDSIDKIRNDLINFYIKNRYTNARVFYNVEKLPEGIFIIIVQEGKINEVRIIDSKYERKREKELEKDGERNKQNEYNNGEKYNNGNKENRLEDKYGKEIDSQNKEKNKQEDQKQQSKPNEKQDKEADYQNKQQKSNNHQLSTLNSQLRKLRLNAQSFFAFPFKNKRDKTFNLKDFEQGLDQMNRLQSNNATIDIRPSKDKDGYSDIHIINDKSFGTSIGADFDNSGSKSTGEKKASVNISQDNLLSINDNIYLKYTEDTEGSKEDRYSKSFYGSISIPFGYWTLSSTVNESKYLTIAQGLNTMHIKGETLTQTHNVDRVLFRRQLFKINAGTKLEIQDTKSFIEDIKNPAGTRKLSNIGFYINNTIYTKLGTIIIKPSYQKGTKWFDAKVDDKDALNTTPKAQYDLVKLYAYYNTRINIPLLTKTKVIDPNTGQEAMRPVTKKHKEGKDKGRGKEAKAIKDKDGNMLLETEKDKDGKGLTIEARQADKKGNAITDKDGNELRDNNNNPIVKLEPITVRNKIPLSYTITIDSQYSWDTLHSTNQMSLGGEYSVRGFKENSISGDNGYTIRNDIRINLQHLFPKVLLKTRAMNYGNSFTRKVGEEAKTKVKTENSNNNGNHDIASKNTSNNTNNDSNHNNNSYTEKTYYPRLSINDALSRTYLNIFYDYGYVEDKHEDSSDKLYNSGSGHMSGFGVGLNYYGKYLNWSLTYAKALHSPNYIQTRNDDRKENHSVYWRVGMGW